MSEQPPEDRTSEEVALRMILGVVGIVFFLWLMRYCLPPTSGDRIAPFVKDIKELKKSVEDRREATRTGR